MERGERMANIITSCRILCSILLLFFPAFSPAFYVLYWLAGFTDVIDGIVARSNKNRSDSAKAFGIQIDSLSDLLSFGVLPAIFVYVVGKGQRFVAVIAALYVLCALIRLAYFNVLEEDRQKETDEAREKYLGIPVTTIAIILPAMYIFYLYKICKRMIYFPILLVIIAIGFLAPVEIKKPKKMGKICMLCIGLVEIAALFIFRGGR